MKAHAAIHSAKEKGGAGNTANNLNYSLCLPKAVLGISV